jgi:hypothetical protein
MLTILLSFPLKPYCNIYLNCAAYFKYFLIIDRGRKRNIMIICLYWETSFYLVSQLRRYTIAVARLIFIRYCKRDGS